MAHTLKGWTAIRYAEKHPEFDGELRKYTDPIEEAREDLSVSQARRVAQEDPRLIYLRVPSGRRANSPRKRKSAKKSPTKRISAALTRFLRKQNPGKFQGVTQVRVRKLKDGGISITPVR